MGPKMKIYLTARVSLSEAEHTLFLSIPKIAFRRGTRPRRNKVYAGYVQAVRDMIYGRAD